MGAVALDMRPDRFGQGRGRDFTESSGRERDHPFSGPTPYPGITLFTQFVGVAEFIPGNTEGHVTTSPNLYRRVHYVCNYVVRNDSFAADFIIDYPRLFLEGRTIANGGPAYTINSLAFNNPSGITLANFLNGVRNNSPITNITQTSTSKDVTRTAGNTRIELLGSKVMFRPIYDEIRALFDNMNDYDGFPPIPSSNLYSAGLVAVGRSSLVSITRVGAPSGVEPFPGGVESFPELSFRITLSKRLVPVQASFSDWVVVRDISQTPAFTQKSCNTSQGVEILDAPAYDDEFENIPSDSKSIERYGFGPDTWSSAAFGGLRPTCL